jgi:hypothetical protein
MLAVTVVTHGVNGHQVLVMMGGTSGTCEEYYNVYQKQYARYCLLARSHYRGYVCM